MRRLLLVLVAIAGCSGGHKHPTTPPGHGSGSGSGTQPPPSGNASVTWKRVETEADLPPAPRPGQYQIHLIDVGTGLSILVRGADFTLLYDAGTNDKDEKPSRVLDYLSAVLGPSGDDVCGHKAADRRGIDHVVLSHPHFDHASALDLVVHCFAVRDFWDSGRVNEAVFYRELVDGLSRSAGTTYHTAASVPDDHGMTVKGHSVTIAKWQRFSEGDEIRLGEGAKFKILHAEGKTLPDPNQNSVVIAVQLGTTRLLLVGDSESGERRDPSEPLGDVEQYLVEQHRDDIRADILQVGHHGSKTSSRHDFLAAVHPSLALVSSGPKQYGHTVLPDQVVIDELGRIGATILRTDERDRECPVVGRIGGDHGPGGCDSYVILVGAP